MLRGRLPKSGAVVVGFGIFEFLHFCAFTVFPVRICCLSMTAETVYRKIENRMEIYILKTSKKYWWAIVVSSFLLRSDL